MTAAVSELPLPAPSISTRFFGPTCGAIQNSRAPRRPLRPADMVYRTANRFRDSGIGGIHRMRHARPSQVRGRESMTARRSAGFGRARHLPDDNRPIAGRRGASRCATLNASTNPLSGWSRLPAMNPNPDAVVALQVQSVGGEPSPSRAIRRASCEPQHRHVRQNRIAFQQLPFEIYERIDNLAQ